MKTFVLFLALILISGCKSSITVKGLPDDFNLDTNTTIQVTKNTTKYFYINTTDSDLVYQVTSSPTNGSIGFSGNQISYTPNNNYVGTDSVSFNVFRGSYNKSSIVYFNVTTANNAPTTSDDSNSTNEDTALNDTVTASDIDLDTLTYSVVSGPSNGTLSSFNTSTGAFTYTPNANYNGSDSFTFKVNDGTVDSNTSTFSITVNSVNDEPVSSNSSFTSIKDIAYSSSISASDVDLDTLTYSIVSNPTNGTLTSFNSSTGTFTYTPNASYTGSDSFTFKANDGTVDSNTATVSITVINQSTPFIVYNFEGYDDKFIRDRSNLYPLSHLVWNEATHSGLNYTLANGLLASNNTGGASTDLAEFDTISPDNKLGTKLKLSNELSISIWYKINTDSTSADGYVYRYSDPLTNHGFYIKQSGSNVEFRIKTSSNTYYTTISSMNDTASLMNLIITLDSSGNLKIYKNGSEQTLTITRTSDLGTVTTLSGDFSTWSIGTNAKACILCGTKSPPVILSELKVFDSAITSGEASYLSTITPTDTSTAISYRMDGTCSGIETTYTTYGAGTIGDPYRICTVAQFDDWISSGATGASKYVKLMADLNFSGKTSAVDFGWVTRFSGGFDGNNYIIYNYNNADRGFFTRVDGATIQNVILKKISLPNFDCTVGRTEGFFIEDSDTANTLTVTNVYMEGYLKRATGSGASEYLHAFLGYGRKYNASNITIDMYLNNASPGGVGGIQRYSYLSTNTAGTSLSNVRLDGVYFSSDTSSDSLVDGFGEFLGAMASYTKIQVGVNMIAPVIYGLGYQIKGTPTTNNISVLGNYHDSVGGQTYETAGFSVDYSSTPTVSNSVMSYFMSGNFNSTYDYYISADWSTVLTLSNFYYSTGRNFNSLKYFDNLTARGQTALTESQFYSEANFTGLDFTNTWIYNTEAISPQLRDSLFYNP